MRSIDVLHGICGECGHQAVAHVSRERPRCLWPGCGCRGMLAQLTPREFQIMKLLASGRSVKEIAGDLELSTKTVEVHKFNIFGKTGARSTIHLTLGALRCGAISLEELPPLPVRISGAR